MKKLIGFIWIIIAVIAFASCGMKECKCFSTNVIKQADTLVSNITDTVSNFTRGDCQEFEKSETYTMDTNIVIYHTVVCE